MGKRLKKMPVIAAESEEQDFDGFDEFAVGKSFDLPVTDEFICTSDEVREACALFGGGEDNFMEQGY